MLKVLYGDYYELYNEGRDKRNVLSLWETSHCCEDAEMYKLVSVSKFTARPILR